MADGRDNGGRWQAGASPNPGGRPKAQRAFAEQIRTAVEREAGGNELTEIALKWARGSDGKAAMAAVRFLAEYGYGKAPQTVNINSQGERRTPAELIEQARRVLERIEQQAGGGGAGEGKVH